MTAEFDPAQHPDTRLPDGPVAPVDRPISTLMLTLLRQLDQTTDAVVAPIRAQLPGYGGTAEGDGIVPRDDLWWSVRMNVEMILRVIAEDREPLESELDARRALGVRRARQHLPVTQLIQAFQIGYIEIWKVLSSRAKAAGPAVVTDLLDAAGRFWSVMHQVSAAVADAHHATSREQGSQVRRHALEFLDALLDLPRNAESTREQAHSLGIDPDDDVVALLRGPRASDEPLRYREAGVLLVERQDSTILLAHPDVAEGRFADEPGPRGVGMRRRGLIGARETIRDATLAYDAARALRRPVLHMDRDWFAVLVGNQLDRLEAIGGDAARLLREDDVTRETVAAFLAADGRLSSAGEALHVHANTVAYRLEKLAERTGLDLRTSDGIVHAVLAMLLAAP